MDSLITLPIFIATRMSNIGPIDELFAGVENEVDAFLRHVRPIASSLSSTVRPCPSEHDAWVVVLVDMGAATRTQACEIVAQRRVVDNPSPKAPDAVIETGEERDEIGFFVPQCPWSTVCDW
jgi:hypothetical protein